jgi:hypothetical protein
VIDAESQWERGAQNQNARGDATAGPSHGAAARPWILTTLERNEGGEEQGQAARRSGRVMPAKPDAMAAITTQTQRPVSK